MEKKTFGTEYGFQTRAVHTGNDIDGESGAIYCRTESDTI